MSSPDRPLTRRDVLRLAALAGTAAAGLSATLASRASAQTPTSWRETVSSGAVERLRKRKIVILGAGIAGLTAAYELDRLGVPCIVIEARTRTGGKIETIRRGDTVDEVDSTQTCQFDANIYFNTGPTRIAAHHVGTLGYLRELAVPFSLWQNDNFGSYFYSPRSGRVRMREIYAALRGHIAALAVQAAAANGDLAQLAFTLQQFGDLDAQGRFIGSTRGGVKPGTGDEKPPEPLPPLSLDDLARIEPFRQFLINGTQMYDQQPTMLEIAGGIDHLPRALTKTLKTAPQLNTEVTAVHRTATGARIDLLVKGRRSSINADDVITTIPPPVLRSIPNDFSPAVTKALDAVVYTSAGKLGFQSTRFWESDDDIYGGFSWTEDDITQLMYPSHDLASGKPACLVGTYVFGEAAGDRFAAQTPQERVKAALTQGARIHPQLPAKAKHGVSRSWAKTKYSLGGWSLTPPPPALIKSDGPFHFAGDFTSYLSGWMEGGVLSAQRILGRLLAA